MKQRKKIFILLDKKNDWLKKYFVDFSFDNKLKKKFSFSVVYKLNKKINIELLFLLGLTKKINLKKYKNINKAFLIHESNLPKGRGFSPVKHQILEKKDKIKCCLISCDEKIDTGKIYKYDFLKIKKTDLYDDIKKKQFLISMKMIKKILNDYPFLKSKEQKGKPTYYRKFTSEDDQININLSIKDEFNKIRSTDYINHQNYFYYKNKKFFQRISKKKI